MSKSSLVTLERRVEILVTNGRQADAQAVIAGVGYDLAGLDEGAALLEAVSPSRARKHELLAEQKKATQAERLAREAASRELTNLSQTVRALFSADIPVLTALGLLTQYERVTTPEGEEVWRAVRLSDSIAEMLARWRQLLDNVATLDSAALARLNAAGWTAERLAAARALVEAYAAADTAQQVAIQAYQQAAIQFKTNVAALRTWYSHAKQLIKLAIKAQDPADQAQLHELLGLNL